MGGGGGGRRGEVAVASAKLPATTVTIVIESTKKIVVGALTLSEQGAFDHGLSKLMALEQKVATVYRLFVAKET